MKTYFSIIVASIFLLSCASTPQEEVSSLDTSHPNYSTVECREARKIALVYDSNMAGRMGLGLALGLLTGPIGFIPALWADLDQEKKSQAVVKELKLQCTGETRVVAEGTKADPLETRLFLVKKLYDNGFIDEDEYTELRKKALEIKNDEEILSN